MIENALVAWLRGIEAKNEKNLGEALTKLVWSKLAPAIPQGTTAIYLSADGDLARLPWAALPVGGRVLLEDYALAQVPHGTWLLDQLRTKPAPSPTRFALFALGGLKYGDGRWPALPGTKVEMDALTAIAPGERIATSGGEANLATVSDGLSKATYAHLATHGEFKADDLTEERKRAEKAMESRMMGDDSRKVAAKNPLGYVGLVLSRGEVMSGLRIVDLKLDHLKLVTLSACETGLGEYTGGEGVQGLQRAFHLAGCPNVVASLWKVSDAATAALMAKFYHELWVNKKPPLAALREAQLTIYRRPELIPDLAGERGAPKLTAALKGMPEAPATGGRDPKSPVADAPGSPKRAATRLWAAFVLSGVGR